ncbi:hypothetical protein Tco_0831627 [Tanacetum coccineum]
MKLFQDMQLIQKLRDDQKRIKKAFEDVSGSFSRHAANPVKTGIFDRDNFYVILSSIVTEYPSMALHGERVLEKSCGGVVPAENLYHKSEQNPPSHRRSLPQCSSIDWKGSIGEQGRCSELPKGNSESSTRGSRLSTLVRGDVRYCFTAPLLASEAYKKVMRYRINLRRLVKECRGSHMGSREKRIYVILNTIDQGD